MLSPHSTCLDAFYASVPLKPLGCWPLAADRALSLYPVQASVLHITQGRVWVTVGEGVQPRDAGYGDCFLKAGEQLEVLAGQRVVFESLNMADPVFFSFIPLNRPLAGVDIASTAMYSGVNTASQPLSDVVQPWRDLRLALGLASSALARLALGLTWGSVVRLGRYSHQ